ncbi:MAG: hypothetical protein CME60_11550 [Halobacteriovoraceae bacterium]|nr:hypothetical protein [Halobacteriovoraceae bacterium]
MEEKNQYLKDFMIFTVAVAVVVSLHYFYNPNDLAMKEINPNPIFVLSVLFSCYRGFKFSIFCSSFSALLYFSLLTIQVDFQEVESIFSLEFLMVPILMILISLVVGDIQQRTINRLNQWREKVQVRDKVYEKLKLKQETQDKEIHFLKKKIVTRLDTIKELHDSAAKLNSLSVEHLTHNFIEVVKTRAQVKKAFFYNLDEQKGEYIFIAPSTVSQEEVDQFDLNSYVCQKAIDTGRLVTIKEIAKELALKDKDVNHSEALKKEPLMSLPIYNAGKIYGLFVILEMPFLEFIPENINIIKELALWYEDSLLKAIEYEESGINAEADIKYKAYKYDYFLRRASEEAELSQRYGIPLNIMKVVFANYDTASEYRKRMLKKFIVEFLRLNLKSRDSVCLSNVESELLIIILDDHSEVKKKAKKLALELEKFNLVVSDADERLIVEFQLSSENSVKANRIKELDSFERVS